MATKREWRRAALGESGGRSVARPLRGAGRAASLLRDAEDARLIRSDVVSIDLLGAIAKLSIPSLVAGDTARTFRMVSLLLDGLRYRTAESSSIAVR